MWNNIVERQLKKHSMKFIIERVVEEPRPSSSEPTETPNISDTGFVDFSNSQSQPVLNAAPEHSKTHFNLMGARLNSKDKFNFSDIGVSSESSLRLITLQSFCDDLPLKVTDIIFEKGILQDGEVDGGIRYIIKRALKAIHYKMTALLSYDIEEAKA